MNRRLLAALLACLAACGEFPDPSTTGASLSVSIEGLPAGATGDVVVTGPGNFNRSIVASATLSNIAAGTYTLTAGSVLTGAAIYAPSVATQSIVVTAGAPTQALVTYAANGTLRLDLQQFATGLVAPVFMIAPSGDARLFVAERAGRLRLIKDGTVVSTPVLDISSRVSTLDERGFLSLAFDPQFASNGFLYVHFNDPTGDVLVERFRMSAVNPDVADPTSSLRILTIPHRTASNHNGGRVAFGADGFLYVSVGDGGGSGDPFGNAQNVNTLLGKLLRIDVANASAAQPYAIPPSNPFAAQFGRAREIWAYGLRNPWRFAFDTTAGLLYIADVGQNLREEVDVAATTAAGLNYGWNLMEASLCFAFIPCAPQGLTAPVLEYNHDPSGGCAIVGGFVYRGSAIPELSGRFFYSDFCSGWLRSFRYGGGQALEQVDWNITNVGQIVSFGEDAAGELYMLTSADVIYKIVRQ